MGPATSTKRVSRRFAPFLALLALLAAVPRPGFYAHHHAGDVAGHVHALPTATPAPHRHEHAHANAHSHSAPHSHDGAEADADGVLLYAAASRDAGDHWHSQAPFQHAAATHAHVVTQVDRVESVATTAARIPAADSPPIARSRGPPRLVPSH